MSNGATRIFFTHRHFHHHLPVPLFQFLQPSPWTVWLQLSACLLGLFPRSGLSVIGTPSSSSAGSSSPSSSQKSAVIFLVQLGKQKCLRRRTSWKALVSASWKTPIIKIFDGIFFDSFSALSGIIFFHIVYFSFLQLPRWKVSLTWFHQEFLAPAFSACPDPFRF